MKEELKVAIYCRVGNEDQLTTDKQKGILELNCRMKEYGLYKVYSANGFRPDYDLMLRKLKQKEAINLRDFLLKKKKKRFWN